MRLNRLVGTALIALAAFASPALASTYNISLTEPGVGDAGPDWFGVFEAPSAGGQITSFNLVVNGVTYDRLDAAITPIHPIFDAVNNAIVGPFFGFFGFVMSGPDVPNAPGIAFTYGWNGPTRQWGYTNCGSTGCGGGLLLDSYTITPASAVPLPAALPLLAGGLGLLGGFGWLRNRKAV